MTDAKLKSYVERIDRVMTSMDEARADIAKIIKDAKGDGYIPKTLRKVATRYHADPSKIATEDALLETYEAALGRVGRALEAIRDGATWQEASKAHDVPRATMARAAAVSKRREVIPPPHDRETGEIPPEQEQPEPQSPVGQAAPFEDTEERGAPNVPCDGGAPVATSTVGPAVTTSTSELAAEVLRDLAERRLAKEEDDLEPPTFLKRERVA